MRRIFTHLNSRLANDSFHPFKAFFQEDPDCPTLVVNKYKKKKNKKCSPDTPQ